MYRLYTNRPKLHELLVKYKVPINKLVSYKATIVYKKKRY